MRRLLAALLAGLLAAPAGIGLAEPAVPPSGRLEMRILRNGDPIGTRVVTYRRDGEALVVDDAVRVEVRIAFVTVYRYSETSRTTLGERGLLAFENATDDNGKKTALRIARREDRLAVDGPAGQSDLPGSLDVVGYWNRETMYDNALVDSTRGTVELFTVAPRRRETITLGGRAVAAWHYRISGDGARDLWYDDAGVLLRMRETGRDGSTIVTERR